MTAVWHTNRVCLSLIALALAACQEARGEDDTRVAGMIVPQVILDAEKKGESVKFRSAKIAVAHEMRDPRSAIFRQVTSHNDFVCGEMNGANAMGGMGDFLPFAITHTVVRDSTMDWELTLGTDDETNFFIKHACGYRLNERPPLRFGYMSDENYSGWKACMTAAKTPYASMACDEEYSKDTAPEFSEDTGDNPPAEETGLSDEEFMALQTIDNRDECIDFAQSDKQVRWCEQKFR